MLKISKVMEDLMNWLVSSVGKIIEKEMIHSYLTYLQDNIDPKYAVLTAIEFR